MEPELPHNRSRSKPLLEKPNNIQVEQQKQPQMQNKQKIVIPSDSIIRPQNTPESLVQAITCPICLNMLSIPHYQCSICSNLFCQKCLQDWWVKNPNTCIFKCTKAQFKTIKRSNTYNAMVQILKIKCQYCDEPKTLAELQTHITKYCPQVNLVCPNLYCSQIVKRKDYQMHLKEKCEFRKKQCQHCKKVIIYKQFESHEQSCPEKQLICEFQGCNKPYKRKIFKLHQLNCSYQPGQCQWCQQIFIKQKLQQHESNCSKKIFTCTWCEEKFTNQAYKVHDCEHKKQQCQLCKQNIHVAKVKEHKEKCMMNSIIFLMKKNTELQQINKKLIEKVINLERKFEQASQNRQEQALEVIDRIKSQQRQLLEKDLARVQYSMKSVQKLKKQQTESHLKLPHLSSSWCPFCREMEKKFKGMLEPLIAKRAQLTKKLDQIKQFRQSKSFVRLSQIRQSSIRQ